MLLDRQLLRSVNISSHPVLIVMAIAVTASLLAEIRFASVRVPVVVWEMVFGIVLGPQLLGLVRADRLLDWLGSVGLAALFFMAGMELELQKIKGRPLSLAVRGWTISLLLGFLASALLHVLPCVHAPMMVAVAMTTTALGTLMLILRDSGRLDSKFGSLLLATGALGEFGPVIAVSLLLTHMFATWQEAVFMLAFVAVAFAAALIALGRRPPKIVELQERGMHSSTQLPVCIALLFLAAFDVMSERIGLEAVLGAFAAGMVVSLASQGESSKLFRPKMEAICFGFLVPFFFVVSGIRPDVGALLHSNATMLLVPMFLILFLLVRGVPVFLYRKDLSKNERLPFALYSATALPMVVAISAIGVHTSRMRSDVAAALVGAGLLSVLLFPTIAGALLSRGARPAPAPK
jgi:Kef-type K+ transport system membrane component KefB